jgi:hypothetical protein
VFGSPILRGLRSRMPPCFSKLSAGCWAFFRSLSSRSLSCDRRGFSGGFLVELSLKKASRSSGMSLLPVNQGNGCHVLYTVRILVFRRTIPSAHGIPYGCYFATYALDYIYTSTASIQLHAVCL